MPNRNEYLKALNIFEKTFEVLCRSNCKTICHSIDCEELMLAIWNVRCLMDSLNLLDVLPTPYDYNGTKPFEMEKANEIILD